MWFVVCFRFENILLVPSCEAKHTFECFYSTCVSVWFLALQLLTLFDSFYMLCILCILFHPFAVSLLCCCWANVETNVWGKPSAQGRIHQWMLPVPKLGWRSSACLAPIFPLPKDKRGQRKQRKCAFASLMFVVGKDFFIFFSDALFVWHDSNPRWNFLNMKKHVGYIILILIKHQFVYNRQWKIYKHVFENIGSRHLLSGRSVPRREVYIIII